MNESYRPDMSLNDLYVSYVTENPRVRSDHTRALIKTTVQRYQEFLGRPATLADLNNATLILFQDYRKNLGRSPRTVERESSKMCTLWRWAALNGWCGLPRFSVQKCAPPTPTAWSPKELRTIFEAAAKYPTAIKGLPGNLVLSAVLRLAYDTGERGAALMCVLWSDINFETKWVMFRGITRKGGIRAKDNCQQLSREAIKALQSLRQHQEQSGQLGERVFPEMHPTSLYGHLRYMLKNAGLPHDRHCMLHKLRRTHATHLHVLGGDATQSLGHDSDTITRGYYLDPRFTRGGGLAELSGGIFARLRRFIRRVRVACGL